MSELLEQQQEWSIKMQVKTVDFILKFIIFYQFYHNLYFRASSK